MRRIGGAIVLGFLALLCVLVVPVWERGWTCVVCRMERIDSRILGVAQSNFRPNECSRWYAEHVEPSHAHAWARMAGRDRAQPARGQETPRKPGRCAASRRLG